jgi:hypothetical protein
MSLKNLCEEIMIGVSPLYDETLVQDIEDLYADLVFKNKNEIYNTSFQFHESSGVYLTPRKILLNGTEEIEGQYLLFEYIAHIPQMILYDFETEEEIIENILSDRGILNDYTTIQVPIIRTKARLFSVDYENILTGQFEELDLKNIIRQNLAVIFK